MWHTAKGDRTLSGPEADLFRLAAGSLLVHLVECDGDWPNDVPTFDQLLLGQKVALLREISIALLRKKESPPRFTALNEATIAAVYEELFNELEAEVEFANGAELRQAVVDALEWTNKEFKDDVRIPRASCRDTDEWQLMIDCCLDFVLWDRDFDLEHILDAPPETAATERKMLGINEDYFTAIPPDPTDTQVKRYVNELFRLLVGRRSARR